MKSLNHISANMTATLMTQKDMGKKYIKLLGFQELSEERALASASEQELRSQIMRLAIEAFRQEEISRGRLIEIGKEFAIDGDKLLELAEATRPD